MRVTPQKGEALYEVKDWEAILKDSVITNIVIAKNVTVAFRNKTNKALTPKYKIKFYNAYGFLLGTDQVFSRLTYMEPKDLGSVKLHFDWYPIEKILRHTTVDLPSDFKTVKWIIISESNTQLK